MEGVWSLKPDTTQNAPLENWPPNAIIQRCSIYPLRVYRQNRFLVELFFIWRWDAQLKICSRTGLLMPWSSTAPSVHWGFTVKTDFLLNRSSFGDGMHNLKYADARKLASWCCDLAPLCHSTERSLRNFLLLLLLNCSSVGDGISRLKSDTIYSMLLENWPVDVWSSANPSLHLGFSLTAEFLLLKCCLVDESWSLESYTI